MKPLYSARLGGVRPEDRIKVWCKCGRKELIPAARFIQGCESRPTRSSPILNAACVVENATGMGNVTISIVWHDRPGPSRRCWDAKIGWRARCAPEKMLRSSALVYSAARTDAISREGR